jgi:hypothetical protein
MLFLLADLRVFPDGASFRDLVQFATPQRSGGAGNVARLAASNASALVKKGDSHVEYRSR